MNELEKDTQNCIEKLVATNDDKEITKLMVSKN